MEKEKIIKLADAFMQEAFQANCYVDLINQYSRNVKEYFDELKISGAFYSYTYNALVIATFMELGKIYDRNRDSVNIKQLLDDCKEKKNLFPQQRMFEINGENKAFPYQHTVTVDEKEFFVLEIDKQRPINEMFGNPDFQITVNMSVDKYFELYEWKYKKIEPIIQNLLKQRNKIYAHNDKRFIGNIEEVIGKFPVSKNDIDSLINFAIEFCRFVLALLTGIYRADKPVNIEDWEGTLKLVRLGNKYRDIEIENQKKKFIEQMHNDTIC